MEYKPQDFLGMRSSASTNVNALATSIKKNVLEGKRHIELDAIGAGAVNQAVKAMAVARGMLAPHGWNFSIIPTFKTIPLPELHDDEVAEADTDIPSAVITGSVPEATQALKQLLVGKTAISFVILVSR